MILLACKSIIFMISTEINIQLYQFFNHNIVVLKKAEFVPSMKWQ